MVCGFLLILLIHSSIACSFPSAGDSVQPEYFGPYVGQVIDVDIAKGIPGVLVAAYWNRTYINLFQPEYKLIHVHETFTDKDGYYKIPEYPSAWKRHFFPVNKPGLIFFKSGYGSAQGYEINRNPGIEKTKVWMDWNNEDTQNKWNRHHGKIEIVKLKKLSSIEDRIALLPYSNSSYCAPKCKTLTRLIHEEEIYLETQLSIKGDYP